LQSFLKIILPALCFQFMANTVAAQLILSGTVFDSSKINFVPGVRVVSTGGLFGITDSLGNYHVTVSEKDSVTFIFRNKPTQKFAVKTIPDPSHFDIALLVPYKGKYSTLKEVVVFAKSYKEDSIENRQTYAKIYNYEKPTISTSITPSGGVGADANEIINIFRFKRNKRLKAFQTRLELEEQEKYVNYRFNKTLVKRITQLDGEQLNVFMIKYRPDYEFTSEADELTFNQYILNCSYKFKIELLKAGASKQKM
jgi:hypothetical protein